VYIFAPGPLDIYSHWAALFMSLCLIFQCSQLIVLRRQWMQNTSRSRYIFRWIYWIVITLTTFIGGIGWAISGKPDAAAVQFLAFTVGLIGISLLLYQYSLQFGLETRSQPRWYLKTARGFNRFFKIIHTAYSILFAIGAITLAFQFRYENP
jgi:hypothetical protein